MTPDWDQLELDDELIDVLLGAELNKPAKVQQAVIPLALAGQDLLVNSPTGTGKTLAFLLPALQHLIDFPRQQPGGARVLILAPTRELAQQIAEQADAFEETTGLRSVLITGGVNYGSQHQLLEAPHDILVATPGRLLDLLNAGQYELEHIEWLIIDEADRMLDMGFAESVKMIAQNALHLKQSLLFSATLESPGVLKFSAAIQNDPQHIVVQPPKREKGKILQRWYQADTAEHKLQLLLRLLQDYPGRRVVFVRTREKVEELSAKLWSAEIKNLTLRGDMPQDERQKIIARMETYTDATLIATDIAARGLDIEAIELVVNYDLPRQADVYLHRIGRTARAGKSGVAVNLVEAHDADLLGRIERYQDSKIERRVFAELKPQYKFPDPRKRSKKKKSKKADAAKSKKKKKS
ncbi:ATP-dependent RNA helicase SrmB [Pseudidiomarina sp. 1APP75-32.1]|uniref:ATP-dependent RNA helicase SrmB n=1 Tax=Pseudidiomarina terrestris TaxID=2820060 RepID=A0AAW7QZ45_9GAMM|nr:MULTISPECIES: ATP-dependent RNA helicase SrmB [unclassified Pseudidiomarina]MDN7125143.1 ATP-dependent RNA helicase SrmB [Pseudidiomarina sp. 1APP75-32.1]MDN7129904.1 ATP-dependent RNA helicase SrmB [Pseudidiomarina sp. 1APR75-15]MDN7138405.1 ATP-dependent RNA helicase SrmB [Pseudidiomarina sp. 1ASP75-14]